MIRYFTRILFLFLILAANVNSQSSNWQYIRPSNTGLGGDYYQCIRVDACGNKWTGGYLPFWSEGSVTRFDDSIFTCWSNFEGYLPADRVYDIAFDNNDGVWVATNGVGNGIDHGGISHFDGTNWTTYNSLNTPLPEDDMRGIAIDHNNVVWATFLNVGTGVGGVAKFDGVTWTVYLPGATNLISGNVDKIAVDAQNNIWIATNLGLVKFDGLNWITYTNANSGITNNNIVDIEIDETTNKIYASTGNSIDIFDGANWTHINSNNSPVSATGLWGVDARGDSVIITTVGGTYLTYIYNGNNWISHPEGNHVYDARIDNEGNFWTAGIGAVEKFDGVNWTHYDGMNTGLTTMFNNEVFVDSKNRAWFGSSFNGGINVFDCPLWQDYNPYNYNVWPQPVSYTGSGTGITEDSFGDIWMLFSGVAGAAVQVSGGNVNDPAAWHVWDNNNSGISLQFLNRAAADHSGNVWVGYDDACSVSKYSHATNSWTNYNLYQLGQITCGAGSGIESIRVDDSNNVWICGLAGLAKYDQVSWAFYSFQNTPLSQGFVMDIAFDQNGYKWIATENGLFKFDNIGWTKYDHNNSSMVGDFVNAVIVDQSGKVWVSSEDPVFPYAGSVSSFDGTTWTAYTTANSGLQEKYINRMALDTLGNIWLLSDTKGAAIFNPNGVIGYDCIDKTLQFCSPTGLSEEQEHTYSLTVYPNPTNGEAYVSFNLAQQGDVIIELCDVTGRLLNTSANKNLKKGKNNIKLDLHVPAGIYYCSVKSEIQQQTIMITVL
jgi:hypothetical protein